MAKFTHDEDERSVVRVPVGGPCWHCGEETNYADLDFSTYLCSEECQVAKVAEWAAADRDATKKYGPPCP